MQTSPQVHVRRATEADVEAMFDIRTSVRQNHMSREQLERAGITPEKSVEMIRAGEGVWVGEVDGVPAAFATVFSEHGTVWAMFVRPEHEGRGLGRALMREAEAWLFGLGWDEIWLLTDPDPAVRANGFYQRLGWTWAGIQPDGQVKYVKARPRPQSESASPASCPSG